MAPAVNAGIANSCNYCEHYHFQKAEVATFSESRSSNLVYTYHRLLINFESFRKLFHFVHYNLLPLRLFSELKTISITEQIHCATKTITSLFVALWDAVGSGMIRFTISLWNVQIQIIERILLFHPDIWTHCLHITSIKGDQESWYGSTMPV